MQNAGDQNAFCCLAVKHHVPGVFQAPPARPDVVAHAAQFGIVREHLAARFQSVNVMHRLIKSPGAEGKLAKWIEDRLRRPGRGEIRPLLARLYRKLERLPHTGKDIALGHAAGIPGIDGGAERGELGLGLLLVTLQGAERGADHFARAIVTSGLDLRCDEAIEFLGQIDIAGGHWLPASGLLWLAKIGEVIMITSSRATYLKRPMLRTFLVLGTSVLALGQTFEVASVKPAVIPTSGGVYFGPARGGPGTSDPEQITWSYATLMDMLMTAYDLKSFQINGPSWISSERYNIIAKVPEKATREQAGVMWQNLLGERFGIVLHRESKDFQVQELMVAAGGHKLKDTTIEDPNAEGPPKMQNGVLTGRGFVTMIRMGSGGPSAHTVAKAQDLARLTALAGREVGRPVLDKTGLTGKYDFELEFMPNIPAGQMLLPPGASLPESDPAPSLADALKKQLGLVLVPNKAKLDVLVIDKAEKVPTAN